MLDPKATEIYFKQVTTCRELAYAYERLAHAIECFIANPEGEATSDQIIVTSDGITYLEQQYEELQAEAGEAQL